MNSKMSRIIIFFLLLSLLMGCGYVTPIDTPTPDVTPTDTLSKNALSSSSLNLYFAQALDIPEAKFDIALQQIAKSYVDDLKKDAFLTDEEAIDLERIIRDEIGIDLLYEDSNLEMASANLNIESDVLVEARDQAYFTYLDNIVGEKVVRQDGTTNKITEQDTLWMRSNYTYRNAFNCDDIWSMVEPQFPNIHDLTQPQLDTFRQEINLVFDTNLKDLSLDEQELNAVNSYRTAPRMIPQTYYPGGGRGQPFGCDPEIIQPFPPGNEASELPSEGDGTLQFNSDMSGVIEPDRIRPRYTPCNPSLEFVSLTGGSIDIVWIFYKNRHIGTIYPPQKWCGRYDKTIVAAEDHVPWKVIATGPDGQPVDICQRGSATFPCP